MLPSITGRTALLNAAATLLEVLASVRSRRIGSFEHRVVPGGPSIDVDVTRCRALLIVLTHRTMCAPHAGD